MKVSARSVMVVLTAMAVFAPVAPAMSGVMSGPAARPSPPRVKITFDSTRSGQQVRGIRNDGSAPTTHSIRIRRSGKIMARSARRTGGRAADTPAFDRRASGTRAVVAVRNRGTRDRLNPGGKQFIVSADVFLDRVSTGSVYDDGDNVVQRGLYNNRSQFKLQIDGGLPTCRISGAVGAAEAVVRTRLPRLTWFRMSCRRIKATGGSRVRLTVTPIKKNGTLATSSAQVAQTRVTRIGDLAFSRGAALAIGGKLNANLTVARESDQFNGRIDNVVLRVLR